LELWARVWAGCWQQIMLKCIIIVMFWSWLYCIWPNLILYQKYDDYPMHYKCHVHPILGRNLIISVPIRYSADYPWIEITLFYSFWTLICRDLQYPQAVCWLSHGLKVAFLSTIKSNQMVSILPQIIPRIASSDFLILNPNRIIISSDPLLIIHWIVSIIMFV